MSIDKPRCTFYSHMSGCVFYFETIDNWRSNRIPFVEIHPSISPTVKAVEFFPKVYELKEEKTTMKAILFS